MSMVFEEGTKNGFAEEFDHLHNYQCKVLHSRKEGTKPANQSRNRYPNIIPCKHSLSFIIVWSHDLLTVDYNRVILETANHSSSDYINASYISVSLLIHQLLYNSSSLMITGIDSW